MNRKKVLGVLIIFFILALPAYATKSKDQPSKPITAEDIVAKMQFQLGLTDAQVAQVKPIIEDHLAQEKQLRLQEAKELRKVLTGQQMYTWNFLQDEQPKEKKKKLGF